MSRWCHWYKPQSSQTQALSVLEASVFLEWLCSLWVGKLNLLISFIRHRCFAYRQISCNIHFTSQKLYSLKTLKKSIVTVSLQRQKSQCTYNIYYGRQIYFSKVTEYPIVAIDGKIIVQLSAVSTEIWLVYGASGIIFTVLWSSFWHSCMLENFYQLQQ